jgi:LacI family transcriptional regulator
MENITLKKISEVLGVSISTVSRALKNHPDISANTINKVKELANTLDYEPNANAISLRTQNSKIFGLMIPSANNSFYGSFLSSLENESRENGYSLMIMQSHDNPDVEKEILRFFRKNRVTGVFACLSPGTKDFEMYQKLAEAEIPVVFFDKVNEDHPYKVCVSDYEAAKIGAEALISKGKKNILAIFGSKKISITKARLAAFQETIKQHHEVKADIVFADSYEQSLEITKDFYSKNNIPDAVFCMSDEILTASVKALQQLGINYPKKTGIISISDGYFPKLFQPEITYVETSGEKLGKKAADFMISVIKKEPLNKNQMVEAVLVEGGSI